MEGGVLVLLSPSHLGLDLLDLYTDISSLAIVCNAILGLNKQSEFAH